MLFPMLHALSYFMKYTCTSDIYEHDVYTQHSKSAKSNTQICIQIFMILCLKRVPT